jgi:hypothetical protein
MCAVLGDDQWRRFGEIKHLPGDMARRHGCGQRFTARRARLRIMVDGGIRVFRPAKRRARMALLTAGFLARRFPQTADARRLLRPVAGRWFAAIAAVQPEPALQVRQPLSQRGILRAKQRILSLQCRYDRIAADLKRAVVSGACVVGRFHRHVDSYRAVTCQ